MMDWKRIHRDAIKSYSRRKHVLWVEDGTPGASGYVVELPSSVSITAALDDFAADYDAGESSKVTVRYQLWQDGAIVASGAHSFTP